MPPPGFLPRLREITRQHGILLIADEVQTGFGRTGELFAVEHWDVEPDILVMAKGIASGLPLSGILARGSCWRLVSRARTAARTAATSSRARPPTRRSTSSRTRGSCRTPRSRAPAARRPPRAASDATRRSATFAGSADGRARVRAARASATPRRPDPDLTKRVLAEALARQADPADGRLVRQRRAHHPAARDDRRRGRPGRRRSSTRRSPPPAPDRDRPGDAGSLARRRHDLRGRWPTRMLVSVLAPVERRLPRGRSRLGRAEPPRAGRGRPTGTRRGRLCR